MNAAAAGLFAALSADGALGALLSDPEAVYEDLAEQGAEPPYIVFNQAGGLSRYTLKQRAWRQPVYVVQGVSHDDSAKVAGQIDDAIDAVLSDGDFTIPGGSLMFCRRGQDVAYVETTGGERLNHRGAYYEIWIR